jgi:multiple sugar transport system permease protein
MENYSKVLTRIPLFRMLLNSLVISFVSTGGQLLIGTLAAYAFAKIRFVGKNVIFMIFLGTF